MTPAAMSLLTELRAAGLTLEARIGGRVRVRPLELLTPERRQAIVSNKPAILAALELERRIRDMAARWRFAPDELADALKSSRTDPAAWLTVLDDDERWAELSERVSGGYPA